MASLTVVEGVKVQRRWWGVIQSDTRRRLLWTGVPTKTRLPVLKAATECCGKERIRRDVMRSAG